MKSTFYGQEDHKHAFSIKLKHFPTFSNYFIFCTLHFVHRWHNLETAENSRKKGPVDTTHISKALEKTTKLDREIVKKSVRWQKSIFCPKYSTL